MFGVNVDEPKQAAPPCGPKKPPPKPCPPQPTCPPPQQHPKPSDPCAKVQPCKTPCKPPQRPCGPQKPPPDPKKPDLRAPLSKALKVRAMGALAFVLFVGLSWKIFVGNARKKNYLEFYRTYPAKEDFERMKRTGVFQSISPEGGPASIS